MQNVYLDHPITIQPPPMPQQLDILCIWLESACPPASSSGGAPVHSAQTEQNVTTIQRSVDAMPIILTRQCKTSIWIIPSPWTPRRTLTRATFGVFCPNPHPPPARAGGPRSTLARSRNRSVAGILIDGWMPNNVSGPLSLFRVYLVPLSTP